MSKQPERNKLNAYLFLVAWLTLRLEDGGNIFLRNVGEILLNSAASHYRVSHSRKNLKK
jgi:hypothetical protein